MRTEFEQAIAAAAEQGDASSQIATIKRAVTNEVRAADPSVSVTFTEYFNHSLAPDMVLRWPTENRERLLFVRPNSSERWLLSDLQYVSAHRPLVFTLEDLSSEGDFQASDESPSVLQRQAREAGTWITDPSGIAAVSSGRVREPSLALLSQALVRGGRGVAGGREITELTEKTEAGFAASRQLDQPLTRSAIQAIENCLDAEQSGRLTRVLRAIWEGHGGASSNFPETQSVGSLADDDFSYLLEVMSQGTVDFWRRIGRGITTAQIGRLRIKDPSVNLQALVFANLENLQAKGVRVIDEPYRLGEPDSPRWLVAKGCLALRGLNWTAYVAARRAEEMPPPDDARAPDLVALKRRAAEGHAPIIQVQLGRDDRAVTYESKNRNDVLDDPGLEQVASDLRISTIEKAIAALEGDRSMGIDFGQKTAIGPTSAVFPLRSLMRSVLPLISDFEGDELSRLRGILEPVPPSG